MKKKQSFATTIATCMNNMYNVTYFNVNILSRTTTLSGSKCSTIKTDINPAKFT